MALAHAAAERDVARAEFLAGTRPGDAAGGVLAPAIADDVRAWGGAGSHVSRVTAPHERGDLRQTSTVRVIHRLAAARASGLLVLEGRAGILKELYLAGGHPQYVSSNVTGERLGEFLVAQGAIGRAALERAVAVMPHFGHRLADTLVGVGLLAPLDASRLLTAQVTGKLIDACAWRKGRFRWYPGKVSPFAVPPLYLDSLRVLAAGASALDVAFVDDWLATHGDRRPRATDDGAGLDGFGLGDALARVYALADGEATLAALTAGLRSDDARRNLGRLMYLLVECERVALA